MKVSALVVGAVAGVVAFTALRAQATTEFDLSVTVNEVAQTWQAWGQFSAATSGTSGLSAIEFSVVGSNGVTVTNSVNGLPVGAPRSGNTTFAAIGYPFSGFGFGSSNGTAGVGIQGIQMTPHYVQDPTTGDKNVLTGVGLTAGSQSNATWAYPVLLANGTYSGSTGTLTIGNTAQQVLVLPSVLPTPDNTGNVGIQTMYADAVGGQALPIYLLGDANGDGTVNLTDFVVWSQNFGQSGKGWAGADFNADGITNLSDFVIWSQHFGQTASVGEIAGSAASGVPEPASLGLLGAGALMLLRRRRSH